MSRWRALIYGPGHWMTPCTGPLRERASGTSKEPRQLCLCTVLPWVSAELRWNHGCECSFCTVNPFILLNTDQQFAPTATKTVRQYISTQIYLLIFEIWNVNIPVWNLGRSAGHTTLIYHFWWIVSFTKTILYLHYLHVVKKWLRIVLTCTKQNV